MSWREVPLSGLEPDGAGWKYDDAVAGVKLLASVRRFGQLRPLVVRSEGTRTLVVDGRRLLAALRAAGQGTGYVVDMGPATRADAVRVQLALAVEAETDYARLAAEVAALLEAGASAGELSGCSPFTAERMANFGVLARLDWAAFGGGDGQADIDWDADGDQAVPPAGALPAWVPPLAAEPEPEAQVVAAPEPVAAQAPAQAPRGRARVDDAQEALF